jgi:taurine-pyruvate aminotransferase
VTTEAVFAAFKEESSDRMGYFRDVSTFGGCTAGPAAALENMRIIEEENLLENVAAMGEYLLGHLNELKNKYEIIGDVRGKGLFVGLELVNDRTTREPVDESVPIAIGAECMAQGVLIGRTNRSFREYNNTIALSPAYIATREDIDEIVRALDNALKKQTK